MLVRDTAPLSLTLTLKPLGRRQLDSVRVVAPMSGKILVMETARGWGRGVSLMAKKRREAKGREVAGFENSPTGWATSFAVALLAFFPLVERRSGQPEHWWGGVSVCSLGAGWVG